MVSPCFSWAVSIRSGSCCKPMCNGPATMTAGFFR